MKTILLSLVLVAAYSVVGHVASSDGMNPNWIMAYGLYCGPFVLLLVSGVLAKPWAVKMYSFMSLLIVLTGAALILSNQALYLLPALAWFFLAFSVLALLTSILYKSLSAISRRATS